MPPYDTYMPSTGLSNIANNNLGASLPDYLLNNKALTERQALIDTTNTNIMANDPMNVTSTVNTPKGVNFGGSTSSLNDKLSTAGKGLSVLGSGLGLANTMYDMYSKFWGDGKDIRKAQKRSINNYNKASEYNYNKTVQDNNHLKQVFSV